jgi:hypothetical protein
MMNRTLSSSRSRWNYTLVYVVPAGKIRIQCFVVAEQVVAGDVRRMTVLKAS